MTAHFEPVIRANYSPIALPPTRRTAIGGHPRAASYDMLGEQFYNFNPVKHGYLPSLDIQPLASDLKSW